MLRTTLGGAACLSFCVPGWVQNAFARDAAGADEPAPPAEESPITVTGSRIRLPGLSGLEPTLSLPVRYLDERGITNVADALNETPGFRSSVTPAGSQAPFGQGVNFIDIFGLGSNRTLTLLDGRRVVTSNVPSIFGNAAPGMQVDLNAIPAILVDHVDRVATSGAPAYGTDAIAGTVNVVLKHRLNGLETRATAGVTGAGDNFRSNLAAAGGFNFAGGSANLTGAISFDRVAGVLANRRAYYRANVGSLPNPCTVIRAGQCSANNLAANLGPAGRTPANDGRVNPGIGFNDSATDGFPAAVLVRSVTIPGLSPGGVVSSGSGAYAWQFAPDGSLIPYNRGIAFGAPIPGPLASVASASGGDGFAQNDYAQITSGLKRLNASLSLSWDMADNARFFAEGLFYHGKGDELVQQPAFNATLFSGVSGALGFRSDNPLLTAQARQQLQALGYSGSFQLSRANADLADLTGSSGTRLYRAVAGVEGHIALGGRAYDYEVSVNYGRNDFTDHGQNINQQHFVNAVNVALSGGNIACSTMPTVTGFPAGAAPVADTSCVPLNLFGAGAASAAALEYVLQDLTSRSRLEQFVINANFGGAPFAIFGNPAGFNIGYEHHEEKGSFQPDPFLQSGLGRSVTIAPTAGKYRLDEFFGEVLLPFVTPDNGFAFSRLEGFGRVRHVRNSVNGTFTAWSAGGRFAPIADIELRGNFTRSFRAPAITELYSPRANIPVSVPDLCSASNIGAGPVPDIRRTNCTAFLTKYPGATPLAAAIATVPGIGGGNPSLANEVADSFTWGATLRPRFIPGLWLTADYIDISIVSPIASLTAAQIAQGCFDNPDFESADPANGNAFCSLIRRGANGQVASDSRDPGVITGFVNGKRIRMSGVQASMGYTAGLSRLGLPGSLEIAGDIFNLRRRLVDITGIAPARSEGLVGQPKWQGQLRLRYAGKSSGFSAHVNYSGAQALSLTGRGPSPSDAREFDHFQAFATVDAALFVDTADDFRLNFSVTNLLGRVGQEYHGTIIPASINDALGRRFAISASKRW